MQKAHQLPPDLCLIDFVTLPPSEKSQNSAVLHYAKIVSFFSRFLPRHCQHCSTATKKSPQLSGFAAEHPQGERLLSVTKSGIKERRLERRDYAKFIWACNRTGANHWRRHHCG
jgi:hypothetical protein